MNKLRILALVHRHLIPPDTIPDGTDIVSAPWRTEYDVISTLKTLGHEVRPLGVHDDLGDHPPCRRGMEAAHCVQPARRIRRHHDLRPERRQPPGVAEALLHRLQSARAAAGARQVAVEKAARVPSDSRARIRGLSNRPADPPAQATEFSVDGQIADAGSLHRHFAGLRRRYRREAEGARHIHPRKHRHARHRGALHRGTGALRGHPRQSSRCSRCRSGSCSSRTCRRKPSALPPIG